VRSLALHGGSVPEFDRCPYVGHRSGDGAGVVDFYFLLISLGVTGCKTASSGFRRHTIALTWFFLSLMIDDKTHGNFCTALTSCRHFLFGIKNRTAIWGCVS